ncbi:MAG: hypothetical protein KKG84_05950, partial [Candidatus Omnitrophica bacterium]|nr:hypothetical protein [Candidatus Omnitrophota bacterium]
MVGVDRKRDNRVCTRRCGGLIICAALMMLTFPSLFCPAETGDAVRVTLKNKGKISGTVLEENEGYVTIDMGFGTTAISRVDIERVDILDENEAYGMSRRTGSVNKTAEEQAWKERIEKNKRISEELIIKRQRAAEHKIKFDDPASIETEAIIDGKVSARFIVDTGAALVVISP